MLLEEGVCYDLCVLLAKLLGASISKGGSGREVTFSFLVESVVFKINLSSDGGQSWSGMERE